MRIVEYFRRICTVVWTYVAHPARSLKNTIIILGALWHTCYFGMRAIRVLRGHKDTWSDGTRARYIWQAAHKHWAHEILSRANVTLIVSGMGHFDGTRYVVVSNHESILDIPVVVGVVPNGRFIAKKEVLSYPVVGGVTRYGGQIIIDRSDRVQSMRAIRDGMLECPRSHLVVFPEGTRTKTGALADFKYGAFVAAKENNIPILPIAISGAYQALRNGPFLDLQAHSVICVTVGEPISAEDVARYEVPILAERARASIAEMLDYASQSR